MPIKNKELYKTYMNEYMKNRWEKRRIKAVIYLGGKCVRCGELEDLDFDHIIPVTKIMTIARASARSEIFFWAEVDKCQLLCKPCHLIKTEEDLMIR